MSAFVVIEVPFDMGVENIAVGRGPARFLHAGADRVLAADSGPAQVVHLRLRDASAVGIDAVVDLNRGLRAAVREAIEEGSRPVVLAGNCNSALGILAGLPQGRVGIVWLDAHGDFHTPETSLSGMLDGMALATAIGHCHAALRERIALDCAVAEENVLLLAVRDLDPGERLRLDASSIAVRPWPIGPDTADAMRTLCNRVDAVYLHIDIDFLDRSDSPGVNCRAPGGMPLREAERLIAEIARDLPVAAVALTNHNPDHDPNGLTAAAGVRLLSALGATYPSGAPR